MGCSGCCSAEKLFVFINIAFAMYGGSLLATAARLTWDPSTYTWFRWLCRLQYRVTTAYIFSAGLWLAALVYIATGAVHPRRLRSLQLYFYGMLVLICSEISYGIWFGVSMWDWWQHSEQAVMARKGMDILHDLKPMLLTLERHQDIAREIYNMIEETEREAPNNVYVIILFLFLSMVLQVVGLVVSWRLQRGLVGGGEAEPPKDWRKKANLHMYTIIDKIF